MRVVVDSNCLRSEELRWFLSLDAAHLAVITDYAWIEAYNGDSLISITKSLEILCEFPDQVLLLKGTKTVGALNASPAGMANRMIIPRNRQEFHKTSAALRTLGRGDPGAVPALLAHEAVAKRQMERILNDAGQLLPALRDLESLFTPQERKSIRTDPAYAGEVIDKALVAADQLYHQLRRSHPSKLITAARKLRVNAFLYRYALSCVIYTLTWIRHGSQSNKKDKLIRNDLVDLAFAAYGTYFNGLMTRDGRLQEIHTELRTVLTALGARLPTAYDLIPYLLVAPMPPEGNNLAAA